MHYNRVDRKTSFDVNFCLDVVSHRRCSKLKSWEITRIKVSHRRTSLQHNIITYSLFPFRCILIWHYKKSQNVTHRACISMSVQRWSFLKVHSKNTQQKIDQEISVCIFRGEFLLNILKTLENFMVSKEIWKHQPRFGPYSVLPLTNEFQWFEASVFMIAPKITENYQGRKKYINKYFTSRK